MRLEEKRSGVKRRDKSADLIRTAEKPGPFRIEEVLQPEDVRTFREYFNALVERGRMYNASEMVSALTLAYGHRPWGFDSDDAMNGFYEYVQKETSFKRNEVLQNVLIAYPEQRERFTPLIEAVWDATVSSQEHLPYSVGPEDSVWLKILKPEFQPQIQLAPELMTEKEELVLKRISDSSPLYLFAEEVVPLLLADPSVKVRIPNVSGVISDMKKEVARLRRQDTDEAWKHIACLIKGLLVLSADQVGVNNKGEVTLGHTGQLPTQPSLPERSIL